MKIEGRRARIVEALRQGADGMDAPRLRELLESTGATAAEVRAVLDELAALGDHFAPSARSSIERLLAQEGARTVAPAAGGKRAHELRAEKRRPWWSGVEAPAQALLHPEPARDVETHGERFSKDDVASLLRNLAR